MTLNNQHHHSIYAPYQDSNGDLAIANNMIKDIARNYKTPFYAYSPDIISKQINIIRSNLPKDMGLHYALKANPNYDVVKAIAPFVDGFDIASGGELEILINAGLGKRQISFAGPGKNYDELKLAIKNDVIIICESMHQLSQASEIAKYYNKQAKIMIRLNDRSGSKGSGLLMSGSNAVFGFDIDDYKKNALDFLRYNSDINFVGFHVFKGSQNLDEEKLAESIDETANLICRLDVISPPKIINIGGGLGITYKPKDKPINLEKLKTSWLQAQRKIVSHFPKSHICIELGRYIVGSAGVYITKIIDKKNYW